MLALGRRKDVWQNLGKINLSGQNTELSVGMLGYFVNSLKHMPDLFWKEHFSLQVLALLLFAFTAAWVFFVGQRVWTP